MYNLHDIQYNDITDEFFYVYDNDFGYSDYELVVKHSEKIVDLIECGDYVNGIRIVNKNGSKLFISNIEKKELKEPIKTIVTKEKFKEIEYIIGGE